MGPLTFRQFVFALIAAFFIYICALVVLKHLIFLLVLFLPPALFFGFFALPIGQDQPTEVWALAKLRYWFKPRRRIWNQSGVKELVTITVPKKIEPVLTNGLDQTEVRSRLKALADTIDTRGWAVKNISVNAYAMPAMAGVGSDRLIDMGSMAQEVQDGAITAADDILDERNNPVAQQFDSMIQRSAQVHRQQLVDQMNSPVPVQTAAQPQPQADYWFMNGSGQQAQAPRAPQAAQIDPAAEAQLTAQLKQQAASHPAPYGHMRTVQPVSQTPPTAPAPMPASATAVAPPASVTDTPDPAIISLANNDDLNVATLAHEANRAKNNEGSLDGDEVSISLH